MAPRYTSFMLRCWRLDGGEQRFKVEHIQSGQRMQASTLAEVTAWIEAFLSESVGASKTHHDHRKGR